MGSKSTTEKDEGLLYRLEQAMEYFLDTFRCSFRSTALNCFGWRFLYSLCFFSLLVAILLSSSFPPFFRLDSGYGYISTGCLLVHYILVLMLHVNNFSLLSFLFLHPFFTSSSASLYPSLFPYVWSLSAIFAIHTFASLQQDKGLIIGIILEQSERRAAGQGG